MTILTLEMPAQNNFCGSTITLKRETSKYNKYMKWHVEEKFNHGGGASEYFKTEKEARANIDRRIKIINGQIQL